MQARRRQHEVGLALGKLAPTVITAIQFFHVVRFTFNECTPWSKPDFDMQNRQLYG